MPGPLSADPLVVAMGGLRPAQTLYLGSAMYVAFWPWGSGSTITIKVGPTAR